MLSFPADLVFPSVPYSQFGIRDCDLQKQQKQRAVHKISQGSHTEETTEINEPHPTARMTRSIVTFVACPCDICGGENVKQSVAIKHKRDAEQAERKAARKLGTPMANPSPAGSKGNDAVDDLVNDVFRWTLGGRTANAQWKQGGAIWERDSEEPLSSSSSPITHAYSTPMLPPATSASRTKDAVVIQPASGARKKTLYDELALLDDKLESRINNIVHILGMDAATLSTDSLKDHEIWLRSTLQTLRAIKSGDDLATKTLLAAMLERVESHISKIEIHNRARAGDVPVRPSEEFDTGALSIIIILRIVSPLFCSQILPAHLH
jgi:hypothetical protein